MAADYSGIAKAAQIRAESLANLGKNIGLSLKAKIDKDKEDKEKEIFADYALSELESGRSEVLSFLKINPDDLSDLPEEKKVSAINDALENYTGKDIKAFNNAIIMLDYKQELENKKDPFQKKDKQFNALQNKFIDVHGEDKGTQMLNEAFGADNTEDAKLNFFKTSVMPRSASDLGIEALINAYAINDKPPIDLDSIRNSPNFDKLTEEQKEAYNALNDPKELGKMTDDQIDGIYNDLLNSIQ